MSSMSTFLEARCSRRQFRIASLLLLLGAFGLPLAMTRLGAPHWIGFLLGAPIYILLVVLTYRRLVDAAFSGGWIVLMIFVFNIGPMWNGIHLGNLVSLMPVVLACVAPQRSEIARVAT